MSEPIRWRRQGAPVWGAMPFPPKVRKYPRFDVTSTKVLDLWIVSAQLEKTFTHYVDDRTVFCTGPEQGCFLSHAKVGKPRFGAWLAVQPHLHADCYLLRLTEVSLAVEARLELMAGSLRGFHLAVWRKHNTVRSELRCRLVIPSDVPTDLHPEIDVRFNVERMIEAEDRKDGKNKAKWGPMRAAHEHASNGVHSQLGARC